MRNYLLIALILPLLLLSGGCGAKSSSQSFLREDIDLSYINRIAVLQFANHTKEEYTAFRVRNMTITQVLAMGIFDVVDKGLVDAALKEEVIEPGDPIDKGTLKRLGQKLNAQAFLMGAVDEAGEGKRGNVTYPEISITLMLIEPSAGLILWQASGHGNGDSLVRRLFGMASYDAYHVGMKLIRTMLATMAHTSSAAEAL